MFRSVLISSVMACALMLGACGDDSTTVTVPDAPDVTVPDAPDAPTTKPAE